jgi:hypothetical protein
VNLGTTTFDIYAGAAQCDVSKGRHVGTFTLEITNTRPIVTQSGSTIYLPEVKSAIISLNGNPLYLQAAHVYSGSTPLPKNKQKYISSPGQFPYKVVFPASSYMMSFNATNFLRNAIGTVPSSFVMHLEVCGIPILLP